MATSGKANALSLTPRMVMKALELAVAVAGMAGLPTLPLGPAVP